MANPKLTDSDRAAVSRSLKQSRLVDASRRLARIVKHADPSSKIKAARTRTEKPLTKWMMHHGGEAFDQPFSPDHKKVIAKIERAINHGGLFALAMPRGQGKTTILKWATLYCLLTGRRRFVVVIAATAEMAQAIIEFARQQIQESDTLHDHYPHVTTYARATDGKAIKAKFQLRSDGKTSGIQWSKTTLVLPEVMDQNGKGYPSNGAILEGHGLTGAIRGKWKDTKTGKTIRPDFVLLDDPQTRESAESESQCNMRERIITGDVLGLAGPRKKIAAVMPCTIVKDGDIAGRFLDHKKHPEWSGETCRMVEEWPKEQDGLWQKYAVIYRTGIAEDRGPDEAMEFYTENRKAMDRGAVVSWDDRIRDGEISAIQTAENLLIETGDQFYAEYQNEPLVQTFSVYTITPELIQSRVDPAQQHSIVPDWAVKVVSATDINPSYALTSATVAFGRDQRAAVLWYDIHATQEPVTKGMPIAVQRKVIYEELARLASDIAKDPRRPNLWVIDGGGTPEGTVIDFTANAPRICGLEAATAFGRGFAQYRATGKHKIIKGENWHRAVESRMRQWIVWHADYWREIAQKGWTGAPGGPGSCSLPVGHHSDFAEQICREKLIKKGDGLSGKTEWKWKENNPHDYGDCMAMAYMGASMAGIGTGGYVEPARGRKKYTQADLRR